MLLPLRAPNRPQIIFLQGHSQCVSLSIRSRLKIDKTLNNILILIETYSIMSDLRRYDIYKIYEKTKIFQKKRGPKPIYRPPFNSIKDLGTGLERPHPLPRKLTFIPKFESIDLLDEILDIRYNRKRCTIKIILTFNTIYEIEHFFYWRFTNAPIKMIEYIDRFGDRHGYKNSLFMKRLYTTALSLASCKYEEYEDPYIRRARLYDQTKIKEPIVEQPKKVNIFDRPCVPLAGETLSQCLERRRRRMAEMYLLGRPDLD